MPHCAAAGRPPFRARSTAEAEEFFVSSLDAWRREQGLDRIVLCGHSLGGYLSGKPPRLHLGARPRRSTAWSWLAQHAAVRESAPHARLHPLACPAACYAMRHPQHVQHLILMCPAGVGRKPADWQPPSSLRDPWTLRGQLFRWVPGCLHRVGGGGPWSST
jgi:pimeloyl-ACP methyl ester carboxylesterase